ncbi:Aste57867_9321 [Aphanomyces stellatus]|uniref:Aste57867_9321 protein n=1 Tax=Aphanomyces stellatus TaxID=120398 RepID=A0A485KMW9_9STRA|nr:hypothetical protein As57867_009285 [Aphanomyces stellatus]VFT86203.1 Aste57867_9321 [Aphanomyces stellatus]
MFQRARLFAVLALLLEACLVESSIPWRPFTALRPGQLLAYFPLDSDLQDASPRGDPAENSQSQVNVNVVLTKHGLPDGSRGVSAFFNGESYIEANVNINSNVHGDLTMGAWVFIPEYIDNHASQSDPTAVYDATSFIMTHAPNDTFERSLGINYRGKGWSTFTGASNNGIAGGLIVKTGTWTFVAASYSQAQQSVVLYVDGQIMTAQTTMRMGLSVLRIGSGGNPGSGFYGFMNHVFVYTAALNAGELNFLRTTVAPTLAPVVGTAGYALQFTPSDLYQVVLPLPSNMGNAMALSMYMTVDFATHSRVCLFSLMAASASTHTIYLGYDPTSTTFVLELNTAQSTWTSGNLALPTHGTWVNFALTWSQNTLNFYLDGQLQATTSYTLPLLQANGNICLGACDGKTGFYGLLDEIQLWNVASLPQDLTLKLRGDEPGLAGYWDMNYASLDHPSLQIQSKAFTFSSRLTAKIQIVAYLDTTSGSMFLAPSSCPVGDQVFATMNQPVNVVLNMSFVGVSSVPVVSISQLPQKGTLYLNPPGVFDITLAQTIATVPFAVSGQANIIFMANPNDFGHNYASLQFTANGAQNSQTVVFRVAELPIEPHLIMQDQITQRLTGFRFEDIDADEYTGTVDATLQITSSQPYIQVSIPNTDLAVQSRTTSSSSKTISLLGDSATVTTVANQLDIKTPSAFTVSTTFSIGVKDTGPHNNPAATYDNSFGLQLINTMGQIPSIQSIQPSVAYVQGGHFVVITGQYVYPNMVCQFYNTTTVATVVSNSQVQCPIPPSPLGVAGIVPLSLLFFGQFESRAVQFSYVSPLQITSVFPTIVNAMGGTIVTIDTSYVTDTMFCILGGAAVVPASILTLSSITCRIPPLSLPSSTLAISPNGVDSSPAISPLVVVWPPKSVWLNPSSGPVGGTSRWIEVHGLNFINQSYCVVDNQRTLMQFESPTMVKCLLPPSNDYHMAPVSVALEGTQVELPILTYEFYTDAQLQSIAPLNGPISGGTLINIYGVNFRNAPALLCRFQSNQTSPAIFISSSSIQCTVPMLTAYVATVDISMNGVDFSSDHLIFYTYDPPRISNIYPPLGPLEGGTMLTVFGDHFPKSALLACVFGARQSPAKFISSNVVQCVTPAIALAQNYIFQLSVNGQDTILNPAISFKYYSALTFSSISVSSGSVLGGSTVRISGTFPPSTIVRCSFGSVFVIATSSSPTEINCIAPYQSQPQRSPMSVAMNGAQYFSTPWLFDYYVAPNIANIEPRLVPQNSTSYIFVYGVFPPNSYAVTCQVGSQQVFGRYSNSSVIQCGPITWTTVGDISVELAWNLIDYTTFRKTVHVHLPVVLEQLTPISSIVGLQQQVTLQGYNFLNLTSLTCVWNQTIITPASFISSTQVQCLSPLTYSMGGLPVAVSLNGGIDMCSPLTFTVVASPQVTSIFPSFGPSLTVVYLSLANELVASSVNCQFDSVIVGAQLVNSTSVMCEVPVLPPPHVLSLRIFVWDQLVTTGFNFTVVEPVTVLQLFPTTVGLDDNNTYIDVYAVMTPQTTLNCRFGQSNATIGVVTPLGFRCLAPLQTQEISLDLYISITNQPFESTGFSISYIKQASIVVHPTLGPISGNTKLCFRQQHKHYRDICLGYFDSMFNTVCIGTIQCKFSTGPTKFTFGYVLLSIRG